GEVLGMFESPVPSPLLMPIDDVRSVSVGGEHTCALRGDGTLWCWGSNAWGQLGDGTFDDHGPVRVEALSDVIAVEAGGVSTWAIVRGGSVFCWGSDREAQLGDGPG